VLVASVAALAACGPTTLTNDATEAPIAAEACNSVEPNMAVPAQMRGNATPSANLPALTGGAMQSGLYDLASGEQFDAAPSWEDARHISVLVTDTHEGTTLDWAERSNDSTVRWTARLETEPTALNFTCGRSGTVPITYASGNGELHLRVPDPSGTGMLGMVFVQRAG
jgi:hypothetical protein